MIVSIWIFSIIILQSSGKKKFRLCVFNENHNNYSIIIIDVNSDWKVLKYMWITVQVHYTISSDIDVTFSWDRLGDILSCVKSRSIRLNLTAMKLVSTLIWYFQVWETPRWLIGDFGRNTPDAEVEFFICILALDL